MRPSMVTGQGGIHTFPHSTPTEIPGVSLSLPVNYTYTTEFCKICIAIDVLGDESAFIKGSIFQTT